MLEFAATLDPKSKPTAVVRKGTVAGVGAAAKKEASWRDLPVEKRIEYALIKVRLHSAEDLGSAPFFKGMFSQ